MDWKAISYRHPEENMRCLVLCDGIIYEAVHTTIEPDRDDNYVEFKGYKKNHYFIFECCGSDEYPTHWMKAPKKPLAV